MVFIGLRLTIFAQKAFLHVFSVHQNIRVRKEKSHTAFDVNIILVHKFTSELLIT